MEKIDCYRDERTQRLSLSLALSEFELQINYRLNTCVEIKIGGIR